jgi:hypothetical protein
MCQKEHPAIGLGVGKFGGEELLRARQPLTASQM